LQPAQKALAVIPLIDNSTKFAESAVR